MRLMHHSCARTAAPSEAKVLQSQTAEDHHGPELARGCRGKLALATSRCCGRAAAGGARVITGTALLLQRASTTSGAHAHASN